MAAVLVSTARSYLHPSSGSAIFDGLRIEDDDLKSDDETISGLPDQAICQMIIPLPAKKGGSDEVILRSLELVVVVWKFRQGRKTYISGTCV